HTDASHRFERGVDPALYAPAIERASQLLAELGGGRVGPVVNSPGQPVWADARSVTLRATAITGLLGQNVATTEVERILTALGMTVTAAGEGVWQVQPPSWRYDIAIEA